MDLDQSGGRGEGSETARGRFLGTTLVGATMRCFGVTDHGLKDRDGLVSCHRGRHFLFSARHRMPEVRDWGREGLLSP